MLPTILLMGIAIASPTAQAGMDVPLAQTSTPLVVAQDTGFAKQASVGQVTLELEPRWQDGAFVLDIRANTHSVDLGGIKLEEAVRLIIGETSIAPTEAGSLSGHHASASLVFPLAKRPTSFTIEIRGVPDVPVRTLRWPPHPPQR